jgi:hypothetical protein
VNAESANGKNLFLHGNQLKEDLQLSQHRLMNRVYRDSKNEMEKVDCGIQGIIEAVIESRQSRLKFDFS